jgi:hypothetical protein
MKNYQKILAVIALSSMCLATAAASDSDVAAKKTKKHHAAKVEEAKPVCEACDAIKQLKEQIAAQQAEIDQLKNAQPQPVGTTDAAAQAAAAAAQQQAAAAAAAAAEANAKAAAAQADIASMKNEVNSAAEEAQKAQKEVGELEAPAYIHYKNIQFIPGGYLAAESVWRQHAEQTDVLSTFNGIPYPSNPTYGLTEWRGTGRQSRLSFKAIGKVGDVKLLGYYEMDFLGAAPTANENQSNSFNIRQRQLYADAEWHGWGVAGGQMWTLNNLTKKGAAPYAFWNPATIDAQYVVGFTFARQMAFRVYKELNGGKETVAFSVENAATLVKGSCPLSGTNCVTSGLGAASFGNGNSFTDSIAPDLIAKVAFDPSFGHFEIRAVGRFFRDRITPTTGSPYNNTTVGGGIAAGAIVPVMNKKVNIIAQALVGRGTARYGDSGNADVTFRPDGTFSPIKNLQGMGGIEWQATPKFQVYVYGGDEYLGRDRYAGGTIGYGLATGNSIRNITQGVTGLWYALYKGGYGSLMTGAQYSYTYLTNWNAAAPGSKTSENMAFTSLRYYLP